MPRSDHPYLVDLIPDQQSIRSGSGSEDLMTLECESGTYRADGETFHIGSGNGCDLRVESGAALKCTIHRQNGVSWIEAIDLQAVLINGVPRNRSVINAGDVLNVDGLEVTVLIETNAKIESPRINIDEDISSLSAEDLCDRIVAEQMMIDEFEAGIANGLSNLFEAIKTADDPEQCVVPLERNSTENPMLVDSNLKCQQLLDQIRDLSEIVADGHDNLLDHENELRVANALITETQERVSRQIDELLIQLQSPVIESEMRASA